MRSKWLAALLLGMSLLLMLSTALAQSDRGAIAGTVLDSSGAAVTRGIGNAEGCGYWQRL